MTAKIATFIRIYTSIVSSKFQNVMPREAGNRFGLALVAATTEIIVLAWVGWWANKR